MPPPSGLFTPVGHFSSIKPPYKWENILSKTLIYPLLPVKIKP